MTPNQKSLLVPIDTYVRTALTQAETLFFELDKDSEAQQTRYAIITICDELRQALKRIEAVAKERYAIIAVCDELRTALRRIEAVAKEEE